MTGHEIPAVVAPRRPGDPPELVSGGSRAADLLGWTPRRPEILNIVTDAWNFMREHPRGYTDDGGAR